MIISTMASEDYYNDTKRFDGQNPTSPYPAPEYQQAPMSSVSGYNAHQSQYYPGPQYPPQTQPQFQPEPYYQNQYQPTGYAEQYHQPPPPPYYQQPYTEQQSYDPPQPGYSPATAATPDRPANPTDPADPNDRGVLGAITGGAAGAYAGHKAHHGVLGTLGGALVGSLTEDAIKNKTSEKKERKSRFGFHRRGSSSSSSSSSSDSEKKDKKPKPAPASQQRSGNFSASSNSISLRGNHELVASCRSRSGHQHESRLPLSSVLTNEFGHFKWRRNGNFGASARNARLTEGGRVLEAELADGRGGWRRDWIRLDERISNDDGNLVFLD
ncbi:CVNH domain-containing protein [Aspergillus carlsbadensis]|nr:CVNH domain-containing protein [Aspergillus carlsbadensis]